MHCSMPGLPTECRWYPWSLWQAGASLQTSNTLSKDGLCCLHWMLQTECLCSRPPFISWSLNSPCNDIWEVIRLCRWRSYERLSVLIRRVTGLLSSLPSMWGHSKTAAICKPERGLSSDPESARTLVLDSPASRTGREKRVLVKPPCLWYFVTAAWADWDLENNGNRSFPMFLPALHRVRNLQKCSKCRSRCL